jgi:hypothetical protein
MSAGLPHEMEKKAVLAFNKLLWIQSDFFAKWCAVLLLMIFNNPLRYIDNGPPKTFWSPLKEWSVIVLASVGAGVMAVLLSRFY